MRGVVGGGHADRSEEAGARKVPRCCPMPWLPNLGMLIVMNISLLPALPHTLRRTIALALGACVLVSSCYPLCGQSKSAPSQASPGAGQMSVLSGRVLEAGSRNPIAEARVSLTSTGYSGPAVQTLSDESGSFKFDNVAPGRYWLSATKAGYPLNGTTVGRGSNSRVLTISPNEDLGHLECLLSRGSAISGRVVSMDGKPVIRASVQAFRRETLSRRPTLLSVGAGATTDDQGRYRLYDIPPGNYVVRVTPQETLLPGITLVGSEEAASRPASEIVSYFPGVASLDLSQPVLLKSEDDAVGYDIVMQKSRTFAISGHISGGREGVGGRLPVISAESAAESGLGRKTAATSGDGSFTFRGLPPGRYILRATAYGEDRQEWLAAADVVDHDIADLPVPRLPMVNVQGSVTTGSTTSDALDAAVRQKAKVGMLPPWLPTLIDAVWADGNEFVVNSLFSGAEYVVVVHGLPREYYTAAISYGGSNALKENIIVAGGTKLEIRVKRGAASLSVKVKDEEGKAFPDAYVLLVGEGEAAEATGGWHAGSSADQYGVAKFENLRPGPYRLYALDTFDTAVLQQAGGLQQFVERAVKLELEEAGSYQREPTLIRFVR